MNSESRSESPGPWAPGVPESDIDKVRSRIAGALFFVLVCASLAGCTVFTPVQSTERHFVLTSIPVGVPISNVSNSPALGLGRVRVPAYLFDTSLAVRKDTNEVEYLASVVWAERLDAGFQRVLAANLSTLLSTDRILLTAWPKDAVAAEVYVTINQFDVDNDGKAVLIAQWRILTPGGDKILKSGNSNLVRKGPPPRASPSAAVGTLSELVADFSRQLAQACKSN